MTNLRKLWFKFLAPTIRGLANESDLVDQHFLALDQSSHCVRWVRERPAYRVLRPVHVWRRPFWIPPSQIRLRGPSLSSSAPAYGYGGLHGDWRFARHTLDRGKLPEPSDEHEPDDIETRKQGAQDDERKSQIGPPSSQNREMILLGRVSFNQGLSLRRVHSELESGGGLTR